MFILLYTYQYLREYIYIPSGRVIIAEEVFSSCFSRDLDVRPCPTLLLIRPVKELMFGL